MKIKIIIILSLIPILPGLTEPNSLILERGEVIRRNLPKVTPTPKITARATPTPSPSQIIRNDEGWRDAGECYKLKSGECVDYSVLERIL